MDEKGLEKPAVFVWTVLFLSAFLHLIRHYMINETSLLMRPRFFILKAGRERKLKIRRRFSTEDFAVSVNIWLSDAEVKALDAALDSMEMSDVFGGTKAVKGA